MKQALQKFIALIFLLAGYCAKAQVKFSASISPSVIGKDEFAQLSLTVENANDIEQIVPPRLRDFNLISGPSEMTSMSVVNGISTTSKSLVYVIKPATTGVFTIPAAFARADGRDYRSNPVTIKVVSKPTGNNAVNSPFNSPFGNMDPFAEPTPRATYNDFILRKGENPADKIRKNMFVRVEVDKNTAYVGEPVVATYKLYTRLKSESNMTKNPSFNGFSVLDMQQPTDMSYSTEKFEGREYNVYILRKVQLYPLLTGNQELGTAEIENNVQFIKAEYLNRQPDLVNDMFRGFTQAAIPPEGIEIQKVTLQSKPLTVLIKPLPDAGKPQSFKGAVGKFSIEAKVEKNNFSTDDDGKMAIIVSGEGNLQMINSPEIAWPQGIEGFDPKATDDLYKGTIPVSGRKIFGFPFTVSKPGNYTLPAVEFSYFDLHDGKYKEIRSNPISITVTQGTGKPRSVIAETNTRQNENYLTRFFDNRLRVVSLVAVLIIIGLIVWLKGDSKKEKKSIADAKSLEEAIEKEKVVEEIIVEQQNPLALTEECLQLNDESSFYTYLNEELKKYVAKKLELPLEEMNRKNIIERLDAKGVSNETSKQLETLIDDIQWHLYTPLSNNEKMKEMYERAQDIIQLMNTYKT